MCDLSIIFKAKMPRIIITGGTGTIGKRLSALLMERGYQVTILTRKMPMGTQAGGGLTYALWNVDAGQIDVQAVTSADAIIHLAGAGVAEKRWSEKRKQEIVDSRTKSSALLVNSLRDNKH